MVVARSEDTLADLARRYNLGYDQIVAANPGVDPWLPGEGRSIVLPTRFTLPAAPREGIVINLAAKRLFYFPEARGSEVPVVITHPIGIGRFDWPTPTGRSYVRSKSVDPIWYVPASVRAEHASNGDPLPAVVPPGPENPLGRFALGLGLPGYLIHGTNKPYGIGMRVSHGCIRLYPEDIEVLFASVPVGTPVQIVDQPYLMGWLDDTLYLEAHEPLEQHQITAEELKALAAASHSRLDSAAVDWRKAQRVAKSSRGIPIPITTGSGDLRDVIEEAWLVRSGFRADYPERAQGKRARLQ
jgi:L,D-transpeptidase ErfK/SrfK